MKSASIRYRVLFSPFFFLANLKYTLKNAQTSALPIFLDINMRIGCASMFKIIYGLDLKYLFNFNRLNYLSDDK